MKVQTVTGQNSFWIGPSPDQQIFVVRRDDTPTGTSDTSSLARRVEPGSIVSVAGVIRALPADLSSRRSEWSLSTANEATLTRERVYLEADTVLVAKPAG
jgi:hypothetical protein